jgi:hypothetical protein
LGRLKSLARTWNSVSRRRAAAAVGSILRIAKQKRASTRPMHLSALNCRGVHTMLYWNMASAAASRGGNSHAGVR